VSKSTKHKTRVHNKKINSKKKNLINYNKYFIFFKKHPDLSWRISTSLITFLALIVIVVFMGIDKTSKNYNSAYITTYSLKNNILIPPVKVETIEEANIRQTVEVQKKIEEEKRLKEREDKINRTIAFLKKEHSPVANYEIASIIVDEAAANNADFRVIIAIMGVESGFCKASFYHNCFGYLNGAKYSSYTTAFQDLVPKISRQYAAKYGWDFVSLAKAYGQHNYTYHAANMRAWAGQI